MARKDCTCKDDYFWLCRYWTPKWTACKCQIECIKCGTTWKTKADYAGDLIGKDESELREVLYYYNEIKTNKFAQ